VWCFSNSSLDTTSGVGRPHRMLMWLLFSFWSAIRNLKWRWSWVYFNRDWNLLKTHRLSSAYNPQSNGKAEVAVKSAKRLLLSNTGASGSLDTGRFLRAMMQFRNTPDRDCELSPAEIVFGRPLRDSFAFAIRLEKFTNPNIRPTWRDAWSK